ncbi:MAG TPA: type II toxin-antitoxin system VapB family antitoxin [Geminicoccaceae bacterium]|nr:type II toxin-antitoxin system VapB family antitoxin [Geminicoccus sp.]HMU52085.1 type II toxin-antitoxin system VapB family antitoxin [Geminicoccaceae bacterium]
MGDTAKLFMHGRSQAVRLPKAFRMPGKEVRIRREGNAVILEPVEPTLEAWFAQLDALEREHPLEDTPPDQPAPQVRRYWYE